MFRLVEHALAWPLESWEPFYVIIGTSAAALTGLQFVVIVLGAETKMLSGGSASAFGTPTVVHFCSVLFLCAVLSAPWGEAAAPAAALGAAGIAGVVYSVVVVLRARRQTDYAPVLEDWLFHCVFPLISYTAVIGGAVLLARNPASALFVSAAAMIALLFIGIHNAWDAVIYVALGPQRRS
jgi:hypothetical protein